MMVATAQANEPEAHGAEERWIGGPRWRDDEPRQELEPERVFAAGLRHHHLANTAYPIAHRETIWRHRVDEGEQAALLARTFAGIGSMSVYVHVPFCERRCRFCEYCVVPEHEAELETAYVDAVLRELTLYRAVVGAGRGLAGFDIGGGTPTTLAAPELARIVEGVRSMFHAAPGLDPSIETTPRIAARCPGKMRALREMGFERISMGLQMANPRVLRAYGRDLNAVDDNRRAMDVMRAAGFRRINIDLMYGLARQSLDEWRLTLEHTLALAPEYVTLYRMRYKSTRVRGEADEMPLERAIEAYRLGRRMLLAAGYRANPGRNAYSRIDGDPGTSSYLNGRDVWSTPYLGLGLGAQTFTNSLLGYNLGAATKRADAYLAAVAAGRLPIQDLYLLPRSEAMAKMIAVSFYAGGINGRAFRTRFGTSLEDRFPAEVEFVRARGLMELRDDVLSLTDEGAEQMNGVVALFYSDRVKAHLLSR